MLNLKFNSLKILSNQAKSANQFEFHQKLNLITASDNSVGKSTLVKLLFWAIGCETNMDTTWKAQDCQTILNFSIGKNIYEILRYKDLITLKDNKVKHEFSKITGDYSDKIASLLGFKVLLTNRGESGISSPPPAYYFLPFYIDQKKSWSSAWDNFENLGQYENWKSTIVKYHVGLLTPRHFELEKEKFDQKTIQKEIDHQVERFSTALEIVASYTPDVKTTLSEEKFEAMTEEIRKDLKELSEEQEKILDELAKNQGEKSYLENQLIILKSCVEELDKDYVYAYENIEGDTLECPLCATQHDNNIFNKASILADKAKAESQLEEIKTLLDKAVKKYNNASKSYNKTKSRITEINNKYVIPEENNNKIKLSDVIENIAGNSIKENVIKAKKEQLDASDNVAKVIKELTKQQKELLTEAEKEEINNSFVLKFTNYTKALNATSINASEINSPLDYNKVVKEGGAAESTRAILAYYLSIFALINNAKSEVLAPFVIDTPNQQEQSLGNYDKIIELIFSELSDKTQVFMCAMENSLLAPFQENGKVITLDEKKLLNTEQYENTLKEFETF